MKERRTFGRSRHRVSCEFQIDGRRHTGIVDNVSARGLFVQSTAQPAEGAEMELVLRSMAGAEIPIRVCVTRRSQPNRTATAVVALGFGVRISWAPEGYYALLAELGSG